MTKTILYVLLLVIAILCVTIAVLIVQRRQKRRSSFINTGETPPEYHYNLRRSPMSIDESYLYGILRGILGAEYLIVPQTPLTSVVERPTAQKAIAKIDRKLIDYGVFRQTEEKRYPYYRLTPVLLIELDDETHTLSNRVERDEFINGLCSQIGLPILHIQKEKQYNEARLKKHIQQLLH